jgi:hypothetical protein
MRRISPFVQSIRVKILAALYRTMGAYAGRYKTDGDKLIVTPEVASGPALVGTEQTYLIEIKGDRYQLNTVPTFSQIFGRKWSRRLSPIALSDRIRY